VYLQFSDFKQIIRDRNEITKVALECAVCVFRRARELAPDQQKPMLSLLRKLISMEEEKNISLLEE
jgi:hypothetical protein